MFTIIANGKKQWRGKCAECGCEFQCHDRDVYSIHPTDETKTPWVNCPNCKEEIVVEWIGGCKP